MGWLDFFRRLPAPPAPAAAQEPAAAPSLTEFQHWLLCDALSHGFMYIDNGTDFRSGNGATPGYPVRDRGEQRVLRNLVAAGLVVEQRPNLFVLTETGRAAAMDTEIKLRRSRY